MQLFTSVHTFSAEEKEYFKVAFRTTTTTKIKKERENRNWFTTSLTRQAYFTVRYGLTMRNRAEPSFNLNRTRLSQGCGGQLYLQPENSTSKYGMPKISTAFSVLHESLHCTVRTYDNVSEICYSILKSWTIKLNKSCEPQAASPWCILTCTEWADGPDGGLDSVVKKWEFNSLALCHIAWTGNPRSAKTASQCI